MSDRIPFSVYLMSAVLFALLMATLVTVLTAKPRGPVMKPVVVLTLNV